MKKLKQIIVVAFVLISLEIPIDLSVTYAQEHAIKVRLRMVPVQVTDGDGNLVKGLSKSDFELFVNGRQVNIQSVEELNFEHARDYPDKQQKIPSSFQNRSKRRIIVVFDFAGRSGSRNSMVSNDIFPMLDASARSVNSPPKYSRLDVESKKVKSAVKNWLEREVIQSDEVAIVTFAGQAKLIQPFTSDKSLLLNSVNALAAATNPMKGLTLFDDPPTDGDEDDAALSTGMRERNQQRAAVSLITFFKELGKEMAGVRGTKHIIILSQGHKIEKDIFTKDLNPLLTEAAKALNSSNCIVNTVGTHDILKSSVVTDQTIFLSKIANKTGGKYMRAGALPDGRLKDVMRTIDNYYELFFSPPDDDGIDFSAVEVRVDKPGISVSHPPGYLQDQKFDHLGSDAEEDYQSNVFWKSLVRNELDSQFIYNLIPLSDGSAILHLRTILRNRDRKNDYEVTVSLGNEDGETRSGKWLFEENHSKQFSQLDTLMQIPSGEISLKARVRDVKTDEQSHLIHSASVPHHCPNIATSSIIFFDRDSRSTASMKLLEEAIEHNVEAELLARLYPVFRNPMKTALFPERAVKGAFIYRGPEYEKIVVQLRNETGDLLQESEVSSQVLTPELELMSFDFILPKLSGNEITLNVECEMEGQQQVIATKKLKIGK